MDKCPYCGEKTEPRDTFCLNCGHRLLNEHLGIPLQVQTIYEETNRSNEDRIDERDMTTWGDPNIRLSQTEAITQSIERKRGHADVIDQIGDRLLELTITKVQLLNNQRVGIVDDKEVEQTLAVITSLEDILTKTMQIYQSGVRV